MSEEIYYIIGKAIDGISLNGSEWLLDENGQLMLFKGKSSAKAYLKNKIKADGNAISDSEIEEEFFFEIAEPEEIVKGVIIKV